MSGMNHDIKSRCRNKNQDTRVDTKTRKLKERLQRCFSATPHGGADHSFHLDILNATQFHKAEICTVPQCHFQYLFVSMPQYALWAI